MLLRVTLRRLLPCLTRGLLVHLTKGYLLEAPYILPSTQLEAHHRVSGGRLCFSSQMPLAT